MVTGLEPFIIAAGKAAGAGAARAAGVSAQGGLKVLRRRKIRALTSGAAGIARHAALEAMSPSQMKALLEFSESAQLEHTAISLARLYVLEGRGRGAEKLAAAVKAEFYAALRVVIGEEVQEEALEAAFAAVNESVIREAQRLLAMPDVAPRLEAELIKTMGALAAASVRNTELLQGIADLDSFLIFEDDYRRQVATLNSTMKLPHAGTTRQVPYDELFVEPRVWVGDKATATPAHHRDAVELAIPRILQTSTRVVILGDPGGGKSTLSRKLAHDLAAADAGKGTIRRTPFFVELKDYAGSVRGRKRTTLVEYLEGLCKSPHNLEAPDQAIEWMLLNDRAVVILDGLDELLDTGLRRDVVEAVEGFATRYPSCPMLVTSRRIGYNEAPLNAVLFPAVQLAEFDQRQVHDYVGKWFTLDESVDANHQEVLASSFMADSVFVSDLRENPLMLSLMCGIYASESYIPRNRPDVYEKCALLLFERWDKQRGIAAPLSFDAHVQAAMRSLALYMYTLDAAGATSEADSPEGINRTKLVSFMTAYLREKRFDNDEDAETAATQFIDFCKGRAWVLTDVGADTYGFTHRTFLEYFAASQLVREHTSAPSLYVHLKPHIRSSSWDVVAQLAVQILGRATEDGADDLLQLVLDDIEGSSDADYHAASFALRAMQFVVPRPGVIHDVVERAYRLHAERSEPTVQSGEAVQNTDLKIKILDELMAVSPENAPRVGSVLREVIAEQLPSRISTQPALTAALAPFSVYVANQYWRKWAEENLVEFSEAISAGAMSVRWLALVEFERGRVSLKQVMDWHGAGALYEFRGNTSARGLRFLPPFFYVFLLFRRRSRFSGMFGDVTVQETVRVGNEILESLPRAVVPWVAPIGEPLDWQWTIEAGGADPQRVGAVAVLLLLPILEARALDASKSGGGPLLPWARTLVEVRAGRAPLETCFDLLEQLFEKSSAGRDLVERWVKREVDVIGPVKKRRRRSTVREGPE